MQLDQFNIASPQQKLLSNLDSAFIKPEDINLPRLRQHSPKTERKSARKQYQQFRQDRRKLMFSSDEEQEHEEPQFYQPEQSDEQFEQDFYNDETPEPEPNSPNASPSPKSPNSANPKSPNPKSPNTKLPKLESEEPQKRKRGRPRKAELDKKAKVVTRRSQRIVANPSLRKHHEEPAQLVPKPLRALGFGTAPVNAVLLTKIGGSGRQKPLTINAERLHTASTRDRRFNLTTLDVLRQFVDEHNPKGAKNEVVSENIVLSEFKAHLLYHIHHLMDLHASIKDISHDIADVQRRKNDMRRNIVDLKKQHAQVGTELNKLRKTYNDDKENHAKFKQMVGTLGSLKTAVSEPENFSANLSDKVVLGLGNIARIFNPATGLREQFQVVNSALSQSLEK